jgi:hypothetical protein
LPKSVKRIIGCQGTIQLVTVTSVIRQLEASDTPASSQNILLIYELFSPEGGGVPFAEFIMNMAKSGPLSFEKIIYIDAQMMADIAAVVEKRGVAAARKEFDRLTGNFQPDEVHACSNWQFGNKLLLNCYSETKKITGGDSIGLYIPEGYFAEKKSFSALKNILRKLSERVLKKLRTIPFDSGHYIALDLASQKPSWPVVKASKELLWKTFIDYGKSIKFQPISKSILNNQDVAVLMTTNFSEAQKMSLENEISAYQEYIQQYLPDGGAVIVKPHPRDSKIKLAKLKEQLQKNYQCEMLDELESYFTPFELFLIELNETEPKSTDRMKFLTFSTACLPIKFLFNKNPEVGFGSALVKKYMYPGYHAGRIDHENDLRQLLQKKI